MRMQFWKNSETDRFEFSGCEGNVVLEGNRYQNSICETSQDNMGNKQYIVESWILQMKEKTKFAEATEANIGETDWVIVYDDEIISNPRNEAITGGQASYWWMESWRRSRQSRIHNCIVGNPKLDGGIELKSSRSTVWRRGTSTSLMAGNRTLAIVFIFMCIVYCFPDSCIEHCVGYLHSVNCNSLLNA